MHNGTIDGFARIKRRLRASLPDDLYNGIEGTTDSEHAFAIFLRILGNTEGIFSAAELGQALVGTIAQLEQWTAAAGSSAPSYFNFAVTDGSNVAAVRYVSDPTVEPASLYYSTGGKYNITDGVCRFLECHPNEQSVVIASERLNDNPKDWTRVAPNHVLTCGPDFNVKVELMDITRTARAKS